MADQVDVIVEVAYEVIRNIVRRSSCVPDKLPLGHFVFHVWAGEVDGEQDKAVAQHIHSICREKAPDWDWREEKEVEKRVNLSDFYY